MINATAIGGNDCNLSVATPKNPSEGTNAIAQARTRQARLSGPTREKNTIAVLLQAQREETIHLWKSFPVPRGPHLTDLERVLVLARATLRYALTLKPQ